MNNTGTLYTTASLYVRAATTVRLYSYRNTTGALVYTRITLLRQEEVFCLKVEARTEQRKGTGE